MGPKLQQKNYGTKLKPLPKLWNQIKIFVKIMGPKSTLLPNEIKMNVN